MNETFIAVCGLLYPFIFLFLKSIFKRFSFLLSRVGLIYMLLLSSEYLLSGSEGVLSQNPILFFFLLFYAYNSEKLMSNEITHREVVKNLVITLPVWGLLILFSIATVPIAGLVLYVLLMIPITPSIIALFLDAKPLPNEGKREEIEEIFSIPSVKRLKTKVLLYNDPRYTFNSLAAGFVPGANIVLISKDLWEELPTPMLKCVLAHELSHIMRKDQLRVGTWYILLLAIGVWAFSLSPFFGILCSLPLFLMAMWVHRRVELGADLCALSLYPHPSDHIKLFYSFPSTPTAALSTHPGAEARARNIMDKLRKLSQIVE